jgi:hypothetical protein
MVEVSVWPEIESLYRSDFARFVRVARAVTGDREAALEAVQEGFADAPEREPVEGSRASRGVGVAMGLRGSLRS